MRHSNRSGLLLFTASIAALFAVGLYVYMYSQTSASVDRTIAAETRVETERASQASGQSTLAVYEFTAEDRTLLAGIFVPADDEVSFIKALESIGPASGASVSISSISTGSSASSDTAVGKISASVAVQGSWQSAMKALVLAEDLPYDVSIDNADLNVSVGAGSKASARTWSLSFGISALTLVEASTTP